MLNKVFKFSFIGIYFIPFWVTFLIFSFISCSKENPNNKNQKLVNKTEENISSELPVPYLPLLKAWKRVTLKKLCSIDFPPTMEIQSGEYKTLQEKHYTELNIDKPDLVVQQSGLNKFSSFNRYARILMSIISGNPGDFEDLDVSLSDEGIEQYDEEVRQSTINEFKGTGLKLLKWFPLAVENINGMAYVHISYNRQLNNNEPVRVDTYLFQNNSYMVKLILSYRISEKNIWEDDFSRSLKSFRIISVK